MAFNPKKTFPAKEFYKKFHYPIHPQYAIDVICKKVNQIMVEKYGNPNNQTMLHCQIDCTRYIFYNDPHRRGGRNEQAAGFQNWFNCALVNSGMDMYALDSQGKMPIAYAVGSLGVPNLNKKNGGIRDEDLLILLKAHLNNGFDIFKKPGGISLWELLCGTGRITEPLLRLLMQYLKRRLNLQLLEEGKAIMEKYGIEMTEEIGEVLIKIAQEVTDANAKKEAV